MVREQDTDSVAGIFAQGSQLAIKFIIIINTITIINIIKIIMVVSNIITLPRPYDVVSDLMHNAVAMC